VGRDSGGGGVERDGIHDPPVSSIRVFVELLLCARHSPQSLQTNDKYGQFIS
jgi:hypothetical protein